MCSNDARATVASMDARVLDAIGRLILTPAALDNIAEKALALALVEARLRERPEQLPKLQAEARKVQRELDNFLALVASGEPPRSVLKEIKSREHQLRQLERQIASYTTTPMDELARERFRKTAVAGISKFKELLSSDVALARQALRKIFRDHDGKLAPLRFYPVERGGVKSFDFKG